MPVMTDEEYKKRLEEARKMRNSVGMFTTDEINNISNNNTLSSFTNANDEYNKRLNEARQLRNAVGFITRDEMESINNINNSTQTDEETIENQVEDVWQKDEDKNVANKPNINNTNVSNNVTSSEQKKATENKTTTLPANSITVDKNTKSYRDIEAKLPSNIKANKVANSKETENAVMLDTKKPTIFEAGEFEDGYQFGDITKTVLGSLTDFTQDLSKGILSTGENVLDIATNIVGTVQNLLGFKEAAKGTRDFANRDLSERWSSLVANVNPIGMLYNIVNGTPDKIFNPAGVTWDKDKNIIENYTNNFSKTWLEESSEKQNYEKSSVFGDYADKAASLVGYTLGMKFGGQMLDSATGTKEIGSSKLGASFSGGNIGLKLGGHTLNLSTLSFAGGMAEGLQEANSKGEYVTETERWSKAFSSGNIEALTEGFFGFLGVGGNDITEKWSKKIVSNITSKAGKYLASLGISASSESAEELLSYGLNFIVDNGIIDKIGPTDFSKDWDSGEVVESMVLAFVSTGLTGGGSFVIGTNSAVKEAENQLGRKLSNEEKNEVTKAVVDATIDERLGQIVGQTSIDDISEFYTAKFDQNGDIQGITPTLGKQIENVNNKVNVKPVIVKNAQTNTYNVVDGKTGLLLDSSPYRNLIQAQAEFAHKMINLDETSINAINEKVGQANIAISNKMQQVVEQARDILDYNQNTNSTQTSQNQSTDDLNNEATNYTNQNIENVTDENKNNEQVAKAVEDITNLTNQISNNSTYSNEEARAIFDKVSKDIPNVHMFEQNGDTYINALDSEGNIAYQAKIKTDNYTGKQIKNIVNNVMKNVTENQNIRNEINNIYNKTKAAVDDWASKYRYITEEDINDFIVQLEDNNDFINEELANLLKRKNITKQYLETTDRAVRDRLEELGYYSGESENGDGENVYYSPKTKLENNMSDKEIRDIVKYNSDGKEIKDNNYVDFLVERYKDNQNISGIETNTDNVEKLLNTTYQEAKKIVSIDDEKKIRNKQKDLMIKELLKKIDEKNFKMSLKLKKQDGQYVDTLLNIEINKTGLNESFNKSISNEKYAVVPFLDKLIKTSQDGIIRNESKQRSNVNEWYYLYNTIKINGELYSVKIDIKKTPQGDRFYVHRVNLLHKKGTSSQIPAVENGTIKTNQAPSIDTSIPQSNTKVKSSTNTNNSMQNNKNNSQNNEKGGNENVEQERFRRSTYNGQETNRMQEGENTRRESKNARSNELVKEKQSKGLSNYQKQQQEKLGKNFYATTVERNDQSKNEQIVSDGFKTATGLDMSVFTTNKSTSEGAFYSNDSIFVKHNSLANKKSTNFRPYHEFGHWLKNNKTEQWQKLYDIVDSSITKEQIRQYKNVLNNNSIFNNMTEEQTKEYIINEIISDYVGNWANDIANWQNYLSTIPQEYQDFLTTIALEEEYVGYNIFGSLEQQNRMNEAITEIMSDIIGKDNNTVSNSLSNEVVFSDRELQDYSENARKNIENLRKQFNKWINLQWKSDNYFDIGKTPNNLLLNSTNIKSLPIIMEEKVLIKATGGKHSISLDEIAKIPGELEKPIIIMNGSVIDSYMLLTNILDKEGNNVWIALHFNKLEKRLKVNKIASMYAKDNLSNFLEKNIRENKILQVDSKRLQELITNRGLQLPKLVQSTLVKNSITSNNKNVNNVTATNNSMQNNQNNTNKIQKSDRNDLDNNSNQNYSQEQEEMQNKQREERRRIAKLIRERSFFTNVYNSDVSEEFRSELRKNRKDYQYEPINNEDTLEKANNKVENNKNIREEFLSKDLNSAEDTAVGEVLIRKALAVQDYEEANILTASLAEKLTKAGQTVQAAAIFKRMSPDGMTLFAQRKIEAINEELKKKYKLNQVFTKKLPPQIKLTDEKIQFINEMMKQMQELENSKKDITDGFTMETIERQQDVILAKVIAKIGEGIPTTKLDKLAAWRNISLLLNSKTIMRNLVSNTLFSTLENVSDVLGVGIDKAVSLVTGERSLLMPDLKTQLKGFKKGLSYAIEDTKEGISTSLGGNKYNIEPTKVFENKLLQKLETASYFGVEGLDRPYMQAKYESALQMIMKLEGLNYGKDIPTEAMKEEALEMANYTTFKDKNAISDLLAKVKKVLNGNKSIGLADVIGLTYTNIPGNLTKKALDYSPTGLYNVFKAYTDLKSKQLNGENIRTAQRQLVQATSRTLIGTGIMAVSIQAFLAGVLTASGDDEDDKVKELVGKENYAINVSGFLRWISGGNPTSQNGDLYVTYSNYEPLSSIMAAAAEMAGAAKEGDGVLTVAHKGITTWINTIAELSTLSNFSSLFEYKNLGGNLTRSISEFPASFIPTTCKQIAQLFEQNSKSNYSDSLISKYVTNPILQRIPGLSSILENNYDTFGNEVKSYNDSTGLGRLFNVFLNTSYTSTVNMDETAQELYDLYLSTGLTDHLPIEVSNYFTYKGQKITLTSEEKAQYQKELGQRTVEAFKEKMQTTEYKNMTDEEKVKALSKIISDLKTEVRGEVILEPRGLAYDATFTPSSSTLSKNGYKLVLTEEMRIEYEKLASDRYKQYEKQGIYSKEKLEDLKSKCKDYAKSQLMQKYRNQLVRNK